MTEAKHEATSVRSNRHRLVMRCVAGASIVFGWTGLAAADTCPAEALFLTPLRVPAGDGPVAITSGDLDGDGDLDLAVANDQSDDVSILLGDGAGAFNDAASFGAGNGPVAITSGDLDSDGDLDLAVANVFGDEVSLLLGDGAGGFAAPASFVAGDGPVAITSGDLDGDGDLDLAVANVTSGDVSILLGDGAGGFAAAVSFAAGDAPRAITSGDLDGDGDLDFRPSPTASAHVATVRTPSRRAWEPSSITRSGPDSRCARRTPRASVRAVIRGASSRTSTAAHSGSRASTSDRYRTVNPATVIRTAGSSTGRTCRCGSTATSVARAVTTRRPSAPSPKDSTTPCGPASRSKGCTRRPIARRATSRSSAAHRESGHSSELWGPVASTVTDSRMQASSLAKV